MASNAPGSRRSPSPFRKKYSGGTSNPLFNDLNRSGLAPEYPSLHGADQANIPAVLSAAIKAEGVPPANHGGSSYIPRPPDPDLDRLFTGERFQQNGMGIATWEVPCMQQALPRPDGPNLPVNESAWPSFFERERWLNLTTSPAHPTLRSVIIDSPAVWAELRQCIELATRLLSLVSETDWFKALLFGARTQHPPDPANPDLPDGHQTFGPLPKQKITSARVENEMDDRGLRLIWRFFDSDDPDAYGYEPLTGFIQGFTWNWYPVKDQSKGAIFRVISLNSKLLEPLLAFPLHAPEYLATQERRAERYNARLMLATTMVHELMHLFVEGPNTPRFSIEPFYMGENLAEVGWSGENQLWRGGLYEWPSRLYFEKSDVPRPRDVSVPGPASLHRVPWPGDHTFQQSRLPQLEIPWWSSTGLGDGIPAFWAATVMRDGFSAAASKFGILAYRPPHLEFMVTTMSKRLRCVKVLDVNLGPGVTPEPGDPRLFVDQYSTCRNHLIERRAAWRTLRPWYLEAYKKWETTPYAVVEGRKAVDLFAVHAAERDEKEATGQVNSLSFVLNRYASDHSEMACYPLWPYMVLEMLMLASLPWISGPERITRLPAREKTPQTNRWFVSQFGAANGLKIAAPPVPSGPEFRDLGNEWFHGGRVPHWWSDRIGGGIPRTRESVYGPVGATDLRDRRRNMILECTSPGMLRQRERFPVPGPLAAAIDALYLSLLAQTEPGSGLATADSGWTGWLRFDFKFPPYDASRFVCSMTAAAAAVTTVPPDRRPGPYGPPPLVLRPQPRPGVDLAAYNPRKPFWLY